MSFPCYYFSDLHVVLRRVTTPSPNATEREKKEQLGFFLDKSETGPFMMYMKYMIAIGRAQFGDYINPLSSEKDVEKRREKLKREKGVRLTSKAKTLFESMLEVLEENHPNFVDRAATIKLLFQENPNHDRLGKRKKI